MKKSYVSITIVLLMMLSISNQTKAQENDKTLNQIRLLLQEKASRTPVQLKISSQLLQAVREKRGQNMAAGLSLEPAYVNADKTGLVKVDVRAKVTDSMLSAIKQMGGKILFTSEKYNSIRAEINLASVESIAAITNIQFIKPAVQAYTAGSINTSHIVGNKNDMPLPKKIQKQPVVVAKKAAYKERLQRVQTQLLRILQTGTINSQGDHAHRADDVRTTYGAQGQGIKIGVLSDSYNAMGGAFADVYNGDLPGTGNPLGNTVPVTVLADDASGSDEGRAMLQIVHDLAPKAQLFFATADGGEASFATNITLLQSTYHCDIIIDDVFYVDEPQFQDGIVAQAVATVTAAGVLYFSSAGNEGSVAKNSAGVWEGDFKDAGSLAFTGSAKKGSIFNWGTTAAPINGNIITSAGEFYGLNWSDPFYASTNDYDLFLISSTGTVKASSTDAQTGTQEAFEGFNVTSFTTGDRLVVFKDSAAQVRAIAVNTFRGTLTSFTTGQTHGHSAVVAAFSVAAASALQTSGSPFSNTSKAEYFTSDGLRRMFYNADGSAITPGNVLFATNGGNLRNKPDITAADGVSTSLPLNGGLDPFYGTSAAAPHAGAIAALIKSINPSISANQMRSLLTSTALDIESPGYDDISGNGIVQAFQAMQTLNPTLVADVSLNNFIPNDNRTGDNANGSVEPGEAINLVVNLKNTSPVNATNVTGTLTTSTNGVTISSASSSYGTIGAGAIANNTSTPFVFNVSNSVACGTPLNFTFTENFGNGGTSPQSYPLVVTVGNQPIVNISGALGTPAATTAKFTSSSGTQTGRINRFAPATTCGFIKTSSLNSLTDNRTYDAYIFTNATASPQCINVTFSSTNGTLLYLVAYGNGGFIPAMPNANFMGDFGSSAVVDSFSFNVPASQNYTLVVHEVNPATAVGTTYNLNVNSNGCNSVILPVIWLDFTAVENNMQAALQWKVANEMNVSSYEVEHSTDGNNFTKIYTLSASTNVVFEKTYNQLHPFPDQGNNYYRIREVDKDGHFTYSKTELINISKTNTIIVAPTVTSSSVFIQSKYIMNNIQLYNSIGQLMLNTNPITSRYTLQIEYLPAGAYYLKIITSNGSFQQKIIKDR